MRPLTQRLATFVVAATLAVGGLSACGGQAQNEPTNAKEVYERYMAAENHDNVHTQTTMKLSIEAAGMTMDMDANILTDTAGDAAHGTVELNALGTNTTSEMYVAKEGDSYTQYMSADESGKQTWTKSTISNSPLTNQFMSDKLFADAEFQKSDNGYTVTVPGSKLADMLKESGVDLSSMLGSLDSETLTKALADSKFVYQFDKSCLLSSASCDFALDLSSLSSSTASVSGTIKVSLNIVASEYGKVDASKVAVPDSVKSSATDTGNINLTDLANLGAAA